MIIWIKKESNAQNYDFIQEIDANKSQVSFPFFSYFLNFPAKKCRRCASAVLHFFSGAREFLPLCRHVHILQLGIYVNFSIANPLKLYIICDKIVYNG